MDADPVVTQYLRDPASGNFVEARWVCPKCKLVEGSRATCSACGCPRPGCVDDDDSDDDPDATDLLPADIGGSD